MAVATPRASTVQTTRASGTVNVAVRAPGAVIQKPTADMVSQPHALARILGHIVERVEFLFKYLASAEQGAVYLRGVALTATSDNTINHGLNRVPTDWQVTDITGAAANIYRVSFSATTIVLHNAGAATTINLKVW